MSNIIPFSRTKFTQDEDDLNIIGVRGQRLMELASLDIPILPGFIITNEVILNSEDSLDQFSKEFFNKLQEIEGEAGKTFNSKEEPLLVKMVVSPTLNMVSTASSIHNIGLCDKTIEGFASKVGEDFAYHEYRGILLKVLNLDLELLQDETQKAKASHLLDKGKKAGTIKKTKEFLEEAKEFYPAELFDDAMDQFLYILNKYREIFQKSEILNDSALVIQAMTFGNYGEQGYFGSYFTRGIVDGKDELSGEYFVESFDSTAQKGKSLKSIDKNVLSELEQIGKKLERNYKEIRQVKFTVENGKLWIIDQNGVSTKSAMAEIQTLLGLHNDKVIDDSYAISAIKPGRLAEILHPVIDKKSAEKLKAIKGGISGAIGAAVGRVYFSTEVLVKEARIAHQRGLNETFILAMPSTYAEDVKAIEASVGVITRDGGYASHAPVVARSLGKIAMVNPDIEFKAKQMKIGSHVIKEGDRISLDVPSYDDPVIYLGEANLIHPTIEDSGLLDYMKIVDRKIGDFDVHANADQPKDAELSKKFGANGIGLCRTEHMFFDEKRILTFRSMIIADNKEDRIKVLDKLQKMQADDFYKLFEIMEGHPVTIRLLDAPLHEFLPHTKEKMEEFIKYYQKDKPKVSANDIRMRCDIMGEVNPMLGHRGVRLAISYPEIYQMQVKAIFEAAYKLVAKKGIVSQPEIMIPIVMNHNELKSVRYGKKIEGEEIVGIKTIEEEICSSMGVEPIPYKVGTMIELPAAALQAGKIARYADFFSFGTNDLTQTTLGLSRDDFNSFFPDYNEFDLLEKNPFKYLNEPVKEMLAMASERARLTRPDLKMGLCGEHGAEPENIKFCMDHGLNYVSCSPYSIPIARLAVAQENVKKESAAK